jgi:hypothetical protein
MCGTLRRCTAALLALAGLTVLPAEAQERVTPV